jgi:hypothetical protein
MFECACGFPLVNLPVTVEVKVAQGSSPTLVTCPLCGERNDLIWQELGVFFRDLPGDPHHVFWRIAGVVEPRRTPLGWVLQKQRLTIRFQRLAVLEPREICHQAVPVFLQEDGRLCAPLLPVRPEFFDCIDEVALDRLCADDPSKVSGLRADRYRCHLPLRGLPGRLVDLPTLPIQPARRGTVAANLEQCAFRGVNLRIWPNVTIRKWSRYLIGLAAATEEGQHAFTGSQRLRAKHRPAGPDRQWLEVREEACSGLSVSASSDERPRWIALELDDGGGRDPEGRPMVMAGGVFAVPQATEDVTGRPQLELAIDFGTSNTCMAFRDETGRARLIPQPEETATSLYLLRGGPEPTEHTGPELWPPSRWFGQKQDLVPSELLLLLPRNEMAARLTRIEQWRFGIDYGLPGPGVTLGYPEDQFLLADFKWAEMIAASAPAFRPYLEKVQQRYLTAVLSNGLVRVLASGVSIPGSVNLGWSYPMAFAEDDLESLKSAFEATLQELSQTTGMSWQHQGGGPNEARAAARNVGDPGADLAVYVDMGGGSTDIAIENPAQGQRLEARNVFLTSVRYAGGDLLNAFAGDGSAGSSCLCAGVGVDRLRRRVRESLRARDVLAAPDLFNSAFREVLDNRARHLYSYLIEYVARMLVSAVFEKQAFRDGRLGQRLKVAIYFLGNGWGLGGALDPEPEKLFAIKLVRRTRDILHRTAQTEEVVAALGEERVREAAAIEIEGEAHRLADVPHPKAAVAFGLLKQAVAEPVGSDLGRRTAILGHTTTVERSRRVLWLRRTDRYERPTGEARLDLHDMLDWQDEDEPGFESGIAGPFELDAGLNQTRAALRRCCKVAQASEWFERGPYEVMLETVFRDKLRTIGAGAYGRRRT